MKKTVHEVLFGYEDPIFELYLELKKKYPFLNFLPDINPVFLMQPNDTCSGMTAVHTGADRDLPIGINTEKYYYYTFGDILP